MTKQGFGVTGRGQEAVAATGEITIPPAPNFPGFTPELQEEWRKRYVAGVRAFDEVMNTNNLQHLSDPDEREMAGRREANRMLRVPEITSYEQAMALPAWQFMVREVRGQELVVVTIDARKYKFPIPQTGS